MPDYVDFINIESFYFYMRLAYPKKYKELMALMDILEPFMPLIIPPKNLDEVIFVFEQGDAEEMVQLEESFVDRSKFIFINTVMMVRESDWQNIVAICRRIREIKFRTMTYV